mgnify:CR=1 FL=1
MEDENRQDREAERRQHRIPVRHELANEDLTAKRQRLRRLQKAAMPDSLSISPASSTSSGIDSSAA